MKKAINKNVKRATALALSMTMLLGLGLSSYAEGEYNVYDEIDTAIIIDDNDVPEVQLEDIYKEVKVLKIATREDFDGVGELQRVKIADDKIVKEETTVDLNAPGAIQRTEAAMDAVGALIASETDFIIVWVSPTINLKLCLPIV